eukprot:15483203-Alexandrium_andersonii.AAC.1
MGPGVVRHLFCESVFAVFAPQVCRDRGVPARLRWKVACVSSLRADAAFTSGCQHVGAADSFPGILV